MGRLILVAICEVFAGSASTPTGPGVWQVVAVLAAEIRFESTALAEKAKDQPRSGWQAALKAGLDHGQFRRLRNRTGYAISGTL